MLRVVRQPNVSAEWCLMLVRGRHAASHQARALLTMGPKRQKTTKENHVMLCGTPEDSSSTQQHTAHTPAPTSLSPSSVTKEYLENSTPPLTAAQMEHSCAASSVRERLQTTAQTEQPHAAFTRIPEPQATVEQREQPPTASTITHSSHPTAEHTEQPPPSFPASQTSIATQYLDIERRLCGKLVSLPYGEAVQYVYNPVDYAWEIHRDFVVKFCRGRKKVLLLGMNPGPWGMGQTGVPFGHVGYAKEWLGVTGRVTRPAQEHPKRPVTGLDCGRNEVSGDRMWGLLKELSGTPDVLFTHVFIHNYCPLFFLKASAKNVTPPELKVKQRAALEEECDRALVEVLRLLEVQCVVGVGKYATDRTKVALRQAGIEDVQVSTLMHPSPVNPAANKGWRDIAIRQLTENRLLHYFQPHPTVA
ncbi:single-strand selective monofunctional uracil DNA glycosylase-like isoform X2 [Portunus trituberculatus]|uniref:single-strand selective monofunctional uracil DNA glycosylase-like isoform X2 n=1 Tax=Portunus trituberculatus TaxID=210409 RepID=UPI001E1CED72|nr:single-strand selective monofunctional uracil DNA glycosylase-like isoform X2 [Portunus trituberculatus]